MRVARRLLASAVASIVGTSEIGAIASLFSPGRVHAMVGEYAGIEGFEVGAFLVVLTENAA